MQITNHQNAYYFQKYLTLHRADFSNKDTCYFLHILPFLEYDFFSSHPPTPEKENINLGALHNN